MNMKQLCWHTVLSLCSELCHDYELVALTDKHHFRAYVKQQAGWLQLFVPTAAE